MRLLSFAISVVETNGVAWSFLNEHVDLLYPPLYVDKKVKLKTYPVAVLYALWSQSIMVHVKNGKKREHLPLISV